MNLSLSGKVALVTGGSRGIGAAAVRMFVAAGARVLFNYEKAKRQADQLVEELSGRDGAGRDVASRNVASNVSTDNCAAVACNLSGTETARELVARTVERFGRLDILVANHGIWPAEDVPIDQMGDSQWRNTVAVNLDSVFALVKCSVAQMKRQERSGAAAGHIVLVSSTAGQRGEAFHCDYAATKGALISMVKGLSTELARDGIYVNCVAPGWVDTDMSASALNDPKSRAAIFAKIPLGRVAKPEEIAAPILFLCTPEAGFITGEVFNVNGGAVLVG
ncbi:MAG TPA: SDR family oxidoreductase [Terriglobales bacterium]|nr:SDR family oxidoreductase [Terriglobales bacterium]